MSKNTNEALVSQLMLGGMSLEQAVAFCTEQSRAETMGLEVCTEKCVEFEAEVTSDGFKMMTSEDGSPVETISFADVFALFGCEASKRYGIEISIEEC